MAKMKPGKRRGKAKKRRPAKTRVRQERRLQEGLEETFPASDPLAITDPTRSIKE